MQGAGCKHNSVSVQLDDAVDRYGSPLYPIGSTQGAEVALQDSSGTLNGWGWADNSISAPATLVYFSATGQHRMRIQQRSDGAMIDQIVLSPDAFISTAPGATKSDTTIRDGKIRRDFQPCFLHRMCTKQFESTTSECLCAAADQKRNHG